MDFLKTLLLYMTATLTLAVEGTAVPQPTATPSPTPAPAVVEMVTPAPSETVLPEKAETEAPVETPVVTPVPVPTITANLHYKNLKQGSRGSDVKKLQQRLIELGYLKEGSADGVYGGQTRNAVRKFQYYNGLQQDGVAGDMTQTYLYENPDAAANPSVTEAPKETAAPAETPAPGNDTPAETATLPLPESTQKTENLQPVEGCVVLNDAGSPMQQVILEDGVNVAVQPRLWKNGETVYVSLEDFVACTDEWILTLDADQMILEAEGYVVVVMKENSSMLVTVDGAETALEPEDILTEAEGYPVSAAFLQKTLKADTVWDEEESTLMVHILPKAVAGSVD